jgi:DNA-binding TFAR19-related protein (PDSD5 family)
MKIRRVTANNHKRAFELVVGKARYSFPYAKAEPAPTRSDPVVAVAPDPELANEAITFTLASGKEGFVHIEQVLEYNEDPAYLRELLLHNLTVEAQQRLATTRLSKREIIRRLKTSASQFYRLIDQTNYTKSVDQVIALLQVLDCEVKVVVRAKSA